MDNRCKGRENPTDSQTFPQNYLAACEIMHIFAPVHNVHKPTLFIKNNRSNDIEEKQLNVKTY